MFAAASLIIHPLPASALAFLDGIGALEMILIAVIGLLLFGGKGLPDMARTVGKVVREFKKATRGVEDEVRRVMHDEPASTPRPKPKPKPAAPLASAALPTEPNESAAQLPAANEAPSTPPEPPIPPTAPGPAKPDA